MSHRFVGHARAGQTGALVATLETLDSITTGCLYSFRQLANFVNSILHQLP
jgi:hypothetical protein